MRLNGILRDLAAPILGLAAVIAVESGALAAPPARTALIETETVQPPRAFKTMCRTFAALCAEVHTKRELDKMAGAMAAMFGSKALKPMLPVLTKARLKQLERVNDAVNVTIKPVTDAGGDRWSFTAAAGDCEDYVLMKREMLARLGWPRSALRITVVHDGVGYHAVLVVATQQGEFVLDNMKSYISRVEDSRYTFIVAQSSKRPGAWVRIKKAR